MSSNMKWNVIPMSGLIISLVLYTYLLGSITAIIIGPFIGLFSGMWAYGAIDKTKVFNKFFEWMNKD